MAHKTEKVPIRTCLGCGRKLPKAGLLRFVWHNSQVYQDKKRCMNGRGVYSCDNDDCLRAFAANPGKISRALRVRLQKINLKK